MNDITLLRTGTTITADSRDVAENFGKRHNNVIRDIETLIEGLLKIEQTPERFFISSSYVLEQNGQTYGNYLLTRDGFSLLVMGFTGEAALQWQMKYIEAFNKMEKSLTQPYYIPETYIEALRLAADLVEKNEAQSVMITKQKQYITATQPAIFFAKSVQASETSILVGDLAKILKQNGLDIGANRLFEKLREEGYLIKRKGSDYNSPTQKAMELRLFEVKQKSITHASGRIVLTKTVMVTGRGQIYFVNKFARKGRTA